MFIAFFASEANRAELACVSKRTDIHPSPRYSLRSQKQPASRSRHPRCSWSKGGSMKRPVGVTVIAILMFFGAAFLALGSLACFFVGIMNMSGGDFHEPVTVA